MTNILATIVVCVVTNITTITGECNVCAMWGIQQGSEYFPGHKYGCPANRLGKDEKEETAKIVEVTTLQFTWDGLAHEVKHERILSRVVRRLKKREEWVESK